jgi:putative hemolysin
MAEAVERLQLGDGELPPQEDIRFSYSRPEQGFCFRAIVRTIERLSGQPRLERLYRSWAANPPLGENIFSAGLRMMRINLDMNEGALERAPREGPLLIVANHPFGVIDGLAIGHIATRLRQDIKIMTHSLLCQPPEARDYILPVDFGGTPDAQQVSLLTRRRAIEWLAGGHCVVVFPAGSVATSQKPFSGPALDPAWHPFIAKLIRVPKLRILPVYFHGQNSRLFQVASHIHYALRIALLFRESARRIGSTVKVSIGETIEASVLPLSESRTIVLNELRRRTLSLAGEEGPDPALEFCWPPHINWD